MNDLQQAHSGACLSVQESTLRKRERIAELRLRRQQQNGRAGLGAGFFEAPDSVIANTSPPLSPQLKAPVSLWSRGLESPESQGFFERGDLALLLRPVEVPDIDALLEPPRRPAQPQARRVPNRPGPLLSARCGAADFTINIPSTSLSPVLPQGWARNGGLLLARHREQREQRRPATVAQQQEEEEDSDDSDEDELPQQRGKPNVDGAVAAQLEVELARNHALHAELARLHLKARKLANLVIANQNIIKKT
ncbi:hypothetical protein GGI19_002489 [Coemansia pectinata]|uniref:Uncharacterized protein n=1 Tax=Coemansia pectinata TaxID=1052879 RepID=A0A9W8LB80_9FUNG|nr:hypothetical protein GGI19_002489 [Coemansia pectinata]